MTATTQPTNAQPSGTATPQASRDAMAAVAAINMGRIPLCSSSRVTPRRGMLSGIWR